MADAGVCFAELQTVSHKRSRIKIPRRKCSPRALGRAPEPSAKPSTHTDTLFYTPLLKLMVE